MEIIFLLIPISLLFIIAITAIFFWAIKTGQYDDLEGPRHQILMDDDSVPDPVERKTNGKSETGPDQ